MSQSANSSKMTVPRVRFWRGDRAVRVLVGGNSCRASI